MGEAARKLEINDYVADAVAANDLDRDSAEKVTGVSGEIKAKIKAAEMEGLLDKRTADNYIQRVDNNSKNRNFLEQLQGEVDVVINFVRKLKAHTDIDKKTVVQAEITEFLSKSPAEQRRYEKGLEEHLKALDNLYEQVKLYSPEGLAKFRTLTKEKAKFVAKIVDDREKNSKEYQGEINKEKELFSTDSEREWMNKFDEQTNRGQAEYLQKFKQEIEAKKSVMKDFAEFPKPIRDKFEQQFAQARRKERVVLIQKMKRALEEQALDVLNQDPNAKHFSEKERDAAMKTFRAKPVKEQTDMFGFLKGMLKFNAELSAKYENLEAEIKLEVQEKMGFTNYYELGFEDKMKAVKIGEALKEPNDKMNGLYETKLQDAVSKNYMSKTTAKLFMDDFEQRDSYGKAEWLALFESQELTPRKQVTEDYQAAVQRKHPDNLAEQERLKNEFYTLGLSKRYEKLDQILKELGGNRETPTGTLSEETVVQPGENRAGESGRVPINHEGALGVHEVDEVLQQSASGETMKKGRKVLTILEELKEREKLSERRNHETFAVGGKKERFAGDAFGEELNERVMDRTGEEKILGRDGEAEEVLRVDVDRANVLKDEEIHGLQNLVTHTRTQEKMRNVDNVQFVSTKNARDLNAETANEQIEKLNAKLKTQARNRGAKKLQNRLGRALTAQESALLNRRTAEMNMEVELQETNE